MKILALDISTSITGFAYFENGILSSSGHINMKKIKGLPEKLDFATIEFQKMDVPDAIVAEAALARVARGKSTAHVINSLIAFNFGLTYLMSRFWKCPVEYIHVLSARKKCGIKIPRGLKSKQKKAIVIEYCHKKFPMLSLPETRNGTYKDFVGDICDAIVLGLSAI